jgi:hypothetical protein
LAEKREQAKVQAAAAQQELVRVKKALSDRRAKVSEALASYTPEDFAEADFTSLGEAAVYLTQHGSEPGPALLDLIAKIQKAAGT